MQMKPAKEKIVQHLLEQIEVNDFRELILRRAVEEGLHEELPDGRFYMTFLEGESKWEGYAEDGESILHSEDDSVEVGRDYRLLAFIAGREWKRDVSRYVIYHEPIEDPDPYEGISFDDIGLARATTAHPYEKFAAHPDATQEILWV